MAQLLAAYPHPSDEDPNLPRHPDQARNSLLVPLRWLLAELAAGLDTRAKLGRPANPAQLARQHYYLRLVGQGATWRRLSDDNAFNYRQACLAENVQYLSQQEATSQLLVWAATAAWPTCCRPKSAQWASGCALFSAPATWRWAWC